MSMLPLDTIRSSFRRILGASGTEYALTAGLISVVSLGTLATIGPMVGDMFGRSDSALERAVDLGDSSGSDGDEAGDTPGEGGPGAGGPGGGGGGSTPGDPLAVQFTLPVLTSADLSRVGFEISGAVPDAFYGFTIGSSEGGSLAGDGNVPETAFVLGPIDLLGLRPGRVELSFSSISAETGEVTEVIDAVDYVEMGDFADIEGVEPLAEITSDAVLVEGFSEPAVVFAPLEVGLILNGVDASPEVGVVHGDELALRAAAPEGFAESRTVAVTVGPLTRGWTITTRDAVASPTNFVDFGSVVREPGERVESEIQLIEGLEVAAPVSIAGEGLPEYRVNEPLVGWSGWTAEPGEIFPDSGLQLRMTASEIFSETSVAEITVGGVARVWEVTTRDPVSAPDAFVDFAGEAGVEPLAVVESGSQTVTGHEAPATISIAGSGGEYSLDEGATWTSEPGTIAPGASVRVKLVAGPEYSTEYETRLVIGGVERSFVATTRDAITAPDVFADFGSITGADPETTVTSESQAISGHEIPVAISIAGSAGEYSLDGGTTWTNEPGMIDPGASVQVRLTTGPDFASDYTTGLTIGGVERSFTVATRDAVTIPDSGFVNFVTQTDLDPDTLAVSNIQTISGLEAPASVSLSGGNAAELQVLDASGNIIRGFASEGTVVPVNGQVQLRQTSPAAFESSATAMLTVGGVTRSFEVATRAAITIPTSVGSFLAQTGVEPMSTIVSNAITVSGQEAPATIVVTGGEYRIDGGDWTTAEGTIASGATIEMRIVAGDGFVTTYSAALTVGGIERSFSVTTREAVTTPDSSFRNFNSRIGIDPGTAIASNFQVITGLEAPATVRISGGNIAQFQIQDANHVNVGTWGTQEAQIPVGGRVRVRQTSLAAYEGSTTATLTVGGVARTFTVTTREANLTPTSFPSFSAVNDADPSVWVTSTTQTVSGQEAPAPITITGGQYRINGGKWEAAEGVIASGDSVELRLTSGAFEQTRTATVTIGGVERQFRVTTREATQEPTSFPDFAPVTGAEPSAWVTSTTQTVSGQEAPAPISITGGEYRINGGNWVTAAGWISSGDTLQLRLTSGAFSQTRTATVIVGGVAKTFTVTTRQASTIPTSVGTFTARNGMEPTATIVSNPITVSGQEAPAPIVITGGQYRINGSGWTGNNGAVASGSSVEVQLTSGSFGQTRTATLTIGGEVRQFQVTTRAASRVPTNFPSFSAVTGAERSTWVSSSTVTVTGQEAPASISITGGQYRINGGSWTTAAATNTFASGSTVQIRVNSSGSYSTAATARLTIGGVARDFRVTTKPQPQWSAWSPHTPICSSPIRWHWNGVFVAQHPADVTSFTAGGYEYEVRRIGIQPPYQGVCGMAPTQHYEIRRR